MPFFLVLCDHLWRARNVIDSEQVVCWSSSAGAFRGGAFTAGSKPRGPVVQGLISARVSESGFAGIQSQLQMCCSSLDASCWRGAVEGGNRH